MIFDKSKVYTAVNATMLKTGDTVYLADSLAILEQEVIEDDPVFILDQVTDITDPCRFIDENGTLWALAYLVKEAAK